MQMEQQAQQAELQFKAQEHQMEMQFAQTEHANKMQLEQEKALVSREKFRQQMALAQQKADAATTSPQGGV